MPQVTIIKGALPSVHSKYTPTIAEKLELKRKELAGLPASSNNYPHSDNDSYNSDSTYDTPYATTPQVGGMYTTQGHPFNDRQMEVIHMGRANKSFNIHGGGGYGKTEVSVPLIQEAIDGAYDNPISEMRHPQWQNTCNGVLVLAYTNTARQNIQQRLKPEYQHHCMTIHKALGYHPEFVTKLIDGEIVEVKNWVFAFNKNDKMKGLHTIIIDEGTLPNLELMQALYDASPRNVRWIVIGDLQQQKPPFGQGILSYICTRTPNIVLNIAYRQKKESPVTTLLFDYQEGRIGCILPPTPVPEGLTNMEKATYLANAQPTAKQIRQGYINFFEHYKGSNDSGALDFTTLPDIPVEDMIRIWQDGDYVAKFIESTQYEYSNSTIILPYNKSFGTILLNKAINSHYSKINNQLTHECYVGFNKQYYAIGDIVMYETNKYKVVGIEPDSGYTGLSYANPEVGMYRDVKLEVDRGDLTKLSEALSTKTSIEDDGMLVPGSASKATPNEEGRYLQISHHITLEHLITGKVITLKTLKEQSTLMGGHATTSYKAQGLQYYNVIGFLHKDHKNLNREMLYTLLTRTEYRVHIICHLDTFWKCTDRQTLKGNGGEEKIEELRKNPIMWAQSNFSTIKGIQTNIK